jgi:hypothetical protein
MSCLGVSFINEVPVVAPLDELPIPIACDVNYPPPVLIPEFPIPPCVDGINITSSGITVKVNGVESGTSTFDVTPAACSWDIGGVIDVSIPGIGDLEDLTTDVADLFSINEDANSSDGVGADVDEPGGHPYRIHAEITAKDVSGMWTQVTVSVLGGKYKSAGQPTWFTELSGDFPTTVFGPTTYTRGSTFNLCFLRIPLLPATYTTGVKAADGNYYVANDFGAVVLTGEDYPVFPFVVEDGGDIITYVKIGDWSVASSHFGDSKYGNKIHVNQIIKDDITIGTSKIAGASVVTDAWDVIVIPGIGDAYTYKIVPSTLNGVVPSNWATTGSGSKTAAKYISLNCTATTGKITSVAIGASAAPVEAPGVLESLPPTAFDVPIGVIGTDGVFYKFVQARPFVAQPIVSFTSDRAVPVIGLAPRIQWWTWSITQP